MTLQVWERQEEARADTRPTRGGSSTRRRLLWAIVILVVVGLVAAAVVVGVRRAAHRGAILDPDNPGREGAQALARVLEDRGVDVTIARGEQDFLDLEPPGPGSTVLVTGTGELSDVTAQNMLDQVQDARRLVLVEPSRFVLSSLDLPVDPAGGNAPGQEVRADCTLDGLTAKDAIVPSGRTYDGTGPGTTECFGFDGTASVVAVGPSAGHPEVVTLGAGDLLSNEAITRLDHAGVAVRLLGQGDRLVWYLPSSLDIREEDVTPTSEIPKALWPLTFLGLFGLLTLMVWRGRRFGPLVTEPLPAVVKAIETTQSRGRLYRKARDTDRAGAVLRTRTTRRLAAYLGLPPTAAAAAVAEAAAGATARDPVAVVELLSGAAPPTEAALVALANDLSGLEKEVRRA